MDAKLLWLSLGFFAAVTMIAMIVWSILFPDKRIWPPNISTPTNRIFVWAITLTIFASAILLAMLDWNSFGWPTVPRWGIGLPLIIAGNWFAWRGALNLGMETTSGAKGKLVTDGFYRYSRNPQYVADMAIFAGWAILSASLWALPVVGAGIFVLAMAPFAEEPWLQKTYGEAFSRYRNQTRRYF